MGSILHHAGDSVLVVVDMQTNMMPAIDHAERVLARAEYLIRCAKLLGVPVLATEQIPAKLGPSAPVIADQLDGTEIIPKSAFSCARSIGFMDALRSTWRTQVVLAGVEAHICVLQTALDLLGQKFDVTVAIDAVGSRDAERKSAGLERAGAAGCALAHTESIVYEWLGDATHERFRDVLQATKRAPL
ncbi:MAG: isochorismatase family protein [Fimbriimonadales bacterium]|nr:isochorismatase family protein [Fimbriimonadales bacterium]